MDSINPCLGCQRCESGPVVTLHDGRTVCNYCPDYRAECLARHVISLPTKDDRRAFVAEWGRKHGQAAQGHLSDLVRKLWEPRRV